MRLLWIQKTQAADPALEALLQAHREAGHQVVQMPLPQADGDFGPLLDAIEAADRLLTWELS